MEAPTPVRASKLLDAVRARWALRLVTDPLFGDFIFMRDPHLFALAYATCLPVAEPPPAFTNALADTPAAAAGNELELLNDTLKDLRGQLGPEVSSRFARDFLLGVRAHAFVSTHRDDAEKALEVWLEQIDEVAARAETSLDENVERISVRLGLSVAEREFLIFQVVRRSSPAFALLASLVLAEGSLAQLGLAAMLSQPTGEIAKATSPRSVLVRAGFFSVDERPFRVGNLSPHLAATLSEVVASDDEFFSRFAKPLTRKDRSAALARIDDRDADILRRLLKGANSERGLNVLVYGPRSIDKQGLVADMLEAEGIGAYAVASKDVPGHDIPGWAFVAQRYVEKQNPNAVLVIDQAETVLSRRVSSPMAVFFGGEGPSEEQELDSDDDLFDSPVRCIWLADRARALTEEAIGRFIFHCEAKAGSRSDRRERISDVVSELGLSDDLERHLAKYSFLSARQVQNAAQLASALTSDPAELEEFIRRSVQQSQRALGREQMEDLRDSVTQYDLANLNVDGRFTPEQIIKALQKRPFGTLCLYGLPGAGKSQLAQQVAVEIDMPIMMRRASDLLSKWVGESEQNIAAMFHDAEAEGAILFLDEADSFLRDRSLARAEWSVTQVNEILQGMERFKGVFIAATNLMQDVDAAALRRFTFKLNFLPMRPEQAWQMFVVEAGFDATTADDGKAEDLRLRLSAIKDLTPGDFATVKRQANLLDEMLTPDDWVEQLGSEAKAKMIGLRRNGMGFAAEVN
jgi:hypothetical protein